MKQSDVKLDGQNGDTFQFLTHLGAAPLVRLGVVCSICAGPQSAVAGVGEASAYRAVTGRGLCRGEQACTLQSCCHHTTSAYVPISYPLHALYTCMYTTWEKSFDHRKWHSRLKLQIKNEGTPTGTKRRNSSYINIPTQYRSVLEQVMEAENESVPISDNSGKDNSEIIILSSLPGGDVPGRKRKTPMEAQTSYLTESSQWSWCAGLACRWHLARDGPSLSVDSGTRPPDQAWPWWAAAEKLYPGRRQLTDALTPELDLSWCRDSIPPSSEPLRKTSTMEI